MFKLFRLFSLPHSVRQISLSCNAFANISASKPSQLESVNVMRSRLLYQSKKRGILENDLIIGAFAKHNLTDMSRDELLAYDKIINGEHMEWDLYYYCVGRKPVPDTLRECSVFHRLCEFARSKIRKSE